MTATTSARRATTWTGAELAAALRSAGVGAGDTLFFHVCLDAMGLPAGQDAAGASETILAALEEVLGPGGTLVVPTYTFSFCRREVFDADESPTVRGLWNTFAEFPELVRRRTGTVRSADPIFSVAARGPRAAELIRDLPPTCLGEGSIQHRVREAGGKVALLGVGLYEATLQHHTEAMAGVPWRYDKLFTGRVRRGAELDREGWIYNVRIRAGNADPHGHRLDQLIRRRGRCGVATVGAGELVAIEAREYFALATEQLTGDPWFTAKGPAGDPITLERERVGAAAPVAAELPAAAAAGEIVRGLWALPRDIVSEGYDAALEALARQLPMSVHQYPTGTECWTWIVPEKWACREAWLETLGGERLFSYADHPLHVVSYSLPFSGEVSREELLRHLHVHPRLPDAIPFIFKYYDRDWGLCCPRELRDALTEERYRVHIDTDFSYGALRVGEVVARGASEDCIVLCAHLCHPAMANDDLSGVATGMAVMRELLGRKDLRYTYRFLIVPETIGSVAWLSRHEALIPRMKGGLFLEMLGTRHPHALQHSLAGGSEVDRCFAHALRSRSTTDWTSPYRTTIGNDEKQFNAPGVRVPMLSLARVLPRTHPEAPYREYHSSRDTPVIIEDRCLDESRDLVLAMIDTLERNRTPVNRFRGEVFCARYGLHVDWYADPDGHRALFTVMDLVDGTRSVADIADACGISFDAAHATIRELERRDLVAYV